MSVRVTNPPAGLLVRKLSIHGYEVMKRFIHALNLSTGTTAESEKKRPRQYVGSQSKAPVLR